MTKTELRAQRLRPCSTPCSMPHVLPVAPEHCRQTPTNALCEQALHGFALHQRRQVAHEDGPLQALRLLLCCEPLHSAARTACRPRHPFQWAGEMAVSITSCRRRCNAETRSTIGFSAMNFGLQLTGRGGSAGCWAAASSSWRGGSSLPVASMTACSETSPPELAVARTGITFCRACF